MFQFLLKMNSKRNVRKFSLLMFALVCASASGVAQYLVTGKITSGEDQSPLPGVNILVKGTSNGTITDANGDYSLSIISGNEVLVFSFVGFVTQEVEISGRTSFDVVLASDAKQLSEIVVTALGIEKDKEIGRAHV